MAMREVRKADRSTADRPSSPDGSSRRPFERVGVKWLVVALLCVSLVVREMKQGIKSRGNVAVVPPGCCLDAIVTLATGGYSANRLISTLRDPKAGAWTGHIYVLTDDVEQYRGEVIMNQFGGSVHTGAVGIDISGSEQQPTFEHEADGYRWDRFLTLTDTFIGTKWQKTQVFKLVPPQINTLLFMDADIEVKLPLARFEVDLVAHMTRPCNASYFEERWYSRNTAGHYNSGIAVYNRWSSAKLMEAWGKLLLTTAFQRDQLALEVALNNTRANVCKLPTKHLFFVADVMSRVLSTITFGVFTEDATFAHMTGHKSLNRMRTTSR